MSPPRPGSASASARPRLLLTTDQVVPLEPSAGSTRWLVGGWPAIVTIWTAEEWARLAERPQDAQACGGGLWCRLRME